MNPFKIVRTFLLLLAASTLIATSAVGQRIRTVSDRSETQGSRSDQIIRETVPVAHADDQVVEIGYASWYNKGFNGSRTASGETYDHHAMTAAHPSLPFNTMVRVTRTDTGKSVVVRVNDRMGASPKHIIDLSGAAAEKLDMMTSGIAHVELSIVQTDSPSITGQAHTKPASDAVAVRPDDNQTGGMTPIRPEVKRREGEGRFTLQIGAFVERTGAEELVKRYPDAWISEAPRGAAIGYRVFYGRYSQEDAARTAQKVLWDRGQDSFLRTITQ